MEPNYAVFRAQMKELKSDMPEDEIYQRYMGVIEPGWGVQHTPALGEDGMYHYLYITERDDGKIYIGKHSTKDLNDGYQGSGYEIQDGPKLGRTFKTTKLHFFKTSDEAYIAEKNIVNASFVNTPKYVLNHVGGGISDKPDIVSAFMVPPSNAVAEERTAKKVIMEVAPPIKAVRSVKGKAWSFSMLEVKPGEVLDYLGPKGGTCKVLDDWNVEYDGKKYGLPALDKLLNGGIPFCKNTLNSFKRGAKTLNEIKAEIQARM